MGSPIVRRVADDFWGKNTKFHLKRIDFDDKYDNRVSREMKEQQKDYSKIKISLYLLIIAIVVLTLSLVIIFSNPIILIISIGIALIAVFLTMSIEEKDITTNEKHIND